MVLLFLHSLLPKKCQTSNKHQTERRKHAQHSVTPTPSTNVPFCPLTSVRAQIASETVTPQLLIARLQPARTKELHSKPRFRTCRILVAASNSLISNLVFRSHPCL